MKSVIFTFVFAIAVGGVAIAKEKKATENISRFVQESYSKIVVEVFGTDSNNI